MPWKPRLRLWLRPLDRGGEAGGCGGDRGGDSPREGTRCCTIGTRHPAPTWWPPAQGPAAPAPGAAQGKASPATPKLLVAHIGETICDSLPLPPSSMLQSEP
mmetsp:Transcript_128075/g.362540  ORF Transcript_128075/g.362540 Transcript_128075/m.362540 type:complete len:102 (+) Transcript_128075:431-736(+)